MVVLNRFFGLQVLLVLQLYPLPAVCEEFIKLPFLAGSLDHLIALLTDYLFDVICL